MNKFDFLFIFFLIFLNFEAVHLSNNSNPNFKVLGVVEIARHGARAPLVKFKKTKEIYFGTKRTQLTINGFRQHFLLGRWMRRRYILGDVYKLFEKNIERLDTSQLEIISSPLQRTIFSAASHILGMFPGAIIKPVFKGHPNFRSNTLPPISKFKYEEKYGKEINFTVVDDNKDNIFRLNLCKRKGSNVFINKEIKPKEIFSIGQEQLEQAINDIIKKSEKYGKLKNQKGKVQEYSISTLKNLIRLLFPVQYHSFYDLKLNKNTIDTIKKFRLNYFYSKHLIDSSYKKLLVSGFFDKIANYFQDQIHGKNNLKYLMFSAHDYNLIDILSNLFSVDFLKEKIFDSLDNQADFTFLFPPLASSILIELIEVKGEKSKFLSYKFPSFYN